MILSLRYDRVEQQDSPRELLALEDSLEQEPGQAGD